MKLTKLFENIPYDPDLDFPQSTKDVIDIGDYILHDKPFPNHLVKHDATFLATDKDDVYAVTSEDSEFVTGLLWYPMITDFDSTHIGLNFIIQTTNAQHVQRTIRLDIQQMLFTVQKVIPQVLAGMRENNGDLKNIPYDDLLDMLMYADDGSGADYTHETLGDFLSDVKDEFVHLTNQLQEYFSISAIYGKYPISKYDAIMRAYVMKLVKGMK